MKLASTLKKAAALEETNTLNEANAKHLAGPQEENTSNEVTAEQPEVLTARASDNIPLAKVGFDSSEGTRICYTLRDLLLKVVSGIAPSEGDMTLLAYLEKESLLITAFLENASQAGAITAAHREIARLLLSEVCSLLKIMRQAKSK